MDEPLFSIITPVWNSGAKIEETVQSVWWQKGASFEHIIIDGNSTDDTLVRLEKYRAGVTLLSESDRGIYDAMNKGIDLARGRYLYFLGAGDRLRPFALEEVARALPSGDLVLLYGNVFMDSTGTIYNGEFSNDKLKNDNICHQAVFYERSIFQEVGKFDLEFKVYADYVLNMKCFGNRKVRKLYIDCVIAKYEGNGMSTSQKDDRFFERRAELIRDYLE